MATIDLIHSIPEELAEKASLADLLETSKGIEAWQDRHGQVLDFIYRHRIIRQIRSSATTLAALQELSEHLARVTHPRRRKALDGLNQPYATRWATYRDILETRIAAMCSDAPKQLMQRAHMKEILLLLMSGAVRRQKDVEDAFGLRKANVTRILNLMEANELIVRQAVGREKHLLPGPNAELFSEKDGAAAINTVRRGSYYLSGKKAA